MSPAESAPDPRPDRGPGADSATHNGGGRGFHQIHALSDHRRQAGLGHLKDDDLFARLTRYLAFENAEKTSNHVERENREYRKRQKGCYRLRSLRSIRALASLLRDRPRPRRVVTVLRRRPPVPTAEEVNATH